MGAALIGLLGAFVGAAIAEAGTWLRERRTDRRSQQMQLIQAVVSLIGALNEAAMRVHHDEDGRLAYVLREARVAAALTYALKPPTDVSIAVHEATQVIDDDAGSPGQRRDQFEAAACHVWDAFMHSVKTDLGGKSQSKGN
jgi:hypothetical protein